MTTPRMRRTRPGFTFLAVRCAAPFVGSLLIGWGLLGFIPAVTSGTHAMQLVADRPGVALFGIFAVSLLHNLFHFALGLCPQPWPVPGLPAGRRGGVAGTVAARVADRTAGARRVGRRLAALRHRDHHGDPGANAGGVTGADGCERRGIADGGPRLTGAQCRESPVADQRRSPFGTSKDTSSVGDMHSNPTLFIHIPHVRRAEPD